jgi:hypothetical protein
MEGMLGGQWRAGSHGGLVALAKFVGDAPEGLIHQPTPERAAVLAGLVIPDTLRNILQNILHHVVSFGVP